MAVVQQDHYTILGVPTHAALDELRAAYRAGARRFHPDVADPDATVGEMARLNEAWRVLSNAELRRSYDATLPRATVTHAGPSSPTNAETTGASVPHESRRHAWLTGVQAQIYRLGHQAGKSATQTLLLRNPLGPRSSYETVVDTIVDELLVDTAARVRAARAAGAAPLDLGVASALIGLRALADRLRRQSSLGITTDMVMAGHLLDRMWDVMAYELTTSVANGLGGNPSVSAALAS